MQKKITKKNLLFDRLFNQNWVVFSSKLDCSNRFVISMTMIIKISSCEPNLGFIISGFRYNDFEHEPFDVCVSGMQQCLL